MLLAGTSSCISETGAAKSSARDSDHVAVNAIGKFPGPKRLFSKQTNKQAMALPEEREEMARTPVSSPPAPALLQEPAAR